MPSTYSSLKFELIATGEQAGTWGNTTNINIGTAIEEAITGSATVTFTSGANAAIALTNTNAAQTARNLRLDLSGTMTTSQYLYVPAIEKFYIINNTLSNTVIVSNGSNAAATGTAVSVPRSTSVMLFNDGVNVTSAISHIPSLANVTISSGNVTVTNLTATTGNVTTGNIASLTVTSNATIAGASITSGNATLTNLTATTGNITTSNISTLTVTSNATIAGVSVTSGNATLTNLTATTANLTNANVTSVLTVAAGTNAAPAITTSGDPNTGIFFPAADTVGIATGGTERLRVDSAGNAGLGVTPNTWYSGTKAIEIGATTALMDISGQTNLYQNAYLNAAGSLIYKTNNFATQYRSLNGQHQFFTAASGTAGNTITFTQAMTLDASGNLGIGTTSPADSFNFGRGIDIGSTTGSFYYCRDTDATNGVGGIGYSGTDVYVVNKAVGNIRFFCNPDSTERARITSGGDFLVAKTAADSTTLGFEARATGAVNCGVAQSTNTYSTYSAYSTTASAYRFYVGMAGTVYATSTTITAISDQRLKENIQDLDVGLDAVMALKPRKFDWKPGKGKDKKGDRGWIAQEFEQVFPDLIDTWADPAPEGEEPYKAVNADLIPVLVKAIQELKAELDATKAEVAAIRGQA
jgi:hypothetical protein